MQTSILHVKKLHTVCTDCSVMLYWYFIVLTAIKCYIEKNIYSEINLNQVNPNQIILRSCDSMSVNFPQYSSTIMLFSYVFFLLFPYVSSHLS